MGVRGGGRGGIGGCAQRGWRSPRNKTSGEGTCVAERHRGQRQRPPRASRRDPHRSAPYRTTPDRKRAALSASWLPRGMPCVPHEMTPKRMNWRRSGGGACLGLVEVEVDLT